PFPVPPPCRLVPARRPRFPRVPLRPRCVSFGVNLTTEEGPRPFARGDSPLPSPALPERGGGRDSEALTPWGRGEDRDHGSTAAPKNRRGEPRLAPCAREESAGDPGPPACAGAGAPRRRPVPGIVPNRNDENIGAPCRIRLNFRSSKTV